MSGLFAKVYSVVKEIPVGKVTTYGQIAYLIQNSKVKTQNFNLKFKINPRIVGFALHANRDPKIPCHRVVNKDGRLAPGYAFGGPNEQRNRLLSEGVPFVDKDHVDLSKCDFKI